MSEYLSICSYFYCRGSLRFRILSFPLVSPCQKSFPVQKSLCLINLSFTWMSPSLNNFLSRNLLCLGILLFQQWLCLQLTSCWPVSPSPDLFLSTTLYTSIPFTSRHLLYYRSIPFQEFLNMQIPYFFDSISFCKIISVQKIHLYDLFLYEIYLFASPSIVSISSFAESLPSEESLRFQMLSLQRTLN